MRKNIKLVAKGKRELPRDKFFERFYAKRAFLGGGAVRR